MRHHGRARRAATATEGGCYPNSPAFTMPFDSVQLLSVLNRMVGLLCGPRGPLRFCAPLVEPYLLRWQQQCWDRNWKIERERPLSQLSEVVPAELIEAVESGWFPPASSVMDVGSGRGQISAWLADRGFRVLGVDLSEQAIELARLHFGGAGPRPEFRAMDVCRTPPDAARFDCLVDRGCFHIIPHLLSTRYVDNLAGWARPGARLLLFCRPGRVARIDELFGTHFDIVRSAPSAYVRSVGAIPRTVSPGRAYWMVRRRG
jgi:SAM-dependent methyltransferase